MFGLQKYKNKLRINFWVIDNININEYLGQKNNAKFLIKIK